MDGRGIVGLWCRGLALEQVRIALMNWSTWNKSVSNYVRDWLTNAFVTENSGMGIIFVSESSTDQAAPLATQAVVYTRDNGSGKTQLCVRFHTGAVQVLATEP